MSTFQNSNYRWWMTGDQFENNSIWVCKPCSHIMYLRVPFVPQMIPGWHMWCRKCQSIGLDFEAHRELIKIMTRPAIMTKNLAIILSESHVSDLKGVLVHNFIWICNYMRGTERRRGNLNENGRGTFCRFVKIGYNRHIWTYLSAGVHISWPKFLVFLYFI